MSVGVKTKPNFLQAASRHKLSSFENMTDSAMEGDQTE